MTEIRLYSGEEFTGDYRAVRFDEIAVRASYALKSGEGIAIHNGLEVRSLISRQNPQVLEITPLRKNGGKRK